MPKRTWTLTDVDQDISVQSLSLRPTDVKGAATGYSLTKRALHGGLREGVDVIEVDNGTLRFVVIPTRGMGLWNASLGGLRIGWRSPVKGPVHPGFVRTSEASGIGWLDGFDELLVRCGLESNGAPEFNDDGTIRYALHGKIANIPAHKVEVSVDGDSGRDHGHRRGGRGPAVRQQAPHDHHGDHARRPPRADRHRRDHATSRPSRASWNCCITSTSASRF